MSYSEEIKQFMSCYCTTYKLFFDFIGANTDLSSYDYSDCVLTISANETRELIINCCNEFIHLLATGANEACNNQQKKTIAPEHVLAGKDYYNSHLCLSLVKLCHTCIILLI